MKILKNKKEKINKEFEYLLFDWDIDFFRRIFYLGLRTDHMDIFFRLVLDYLPSKKEQAEMFERIGINKFLNKFADVILTIYKKIRK